MGDAFAGFSDTAPTDPVAAAANALPDDTSALADAPDVSDAGQQAAPLPDPAPWVAQTPRIPVPTTPPMPGSPLQSDPRARLIAIAALGAALGAGPRTGVGVGALHGALQAMADKHADDLQRWKFAASEAEKQQQAVQSQQAIQDRQTTAKLQTTFAQIRMDVSNAKDEDDYRKKIGTWAGLLQLDGVRMQPQALMAQFPYAPASDDDLVKQKVDAYFKSPYITALMKTNPTAAMAGAVSYQRNGVTVRLPIKDALSRIGQDPPTMGPDGQPLFNPIGKGTDAEQAIQRASQEFQTQFGRAPSAGNAKDNDWITTRAKQFTDKKDPAMESMARTLEQLRINQSQNALSQQPNDEDAKTIAQQLVNHKMAPSQLSLFGGFGTAGQAFKRKVLLEAQKLQPGFDMEEAESTYQLAKSPGFQTTVRYMDYVGTSVDRVLSSAQTLANGNIRAVNALINSGKNQFNNVDLKKYQTDVLEMSDAIAKILQGGGTGSGTSDAKLKQAQQILSTTDSPASVAAALGEIKSLITARRGSLTKGTYLEQPAAASPNANRFTVVQKGGQ